MNSPTSLTRFIGTPRGFAVLGWMGGAVPWWLGIIALCSVGTVRKGVLEMKRYDAWASEWRSMTGAPATCKPPKLPPRRGLMAALAAAFALIAWVIWNMTPLGQKASDGQAVM